MLANPSIVYSFVWLLSLFFYTKYWSNIFLTLSNFTIIYILASIFVALFSWFFFIVITKSTRVAYKRKLLYFNFNTENKIKLLMKIWIIGAIVELLYFRDLPILSVFGMSSMSYHDFGLPSFHGFLSAIILSISMYMIYKFLLYKKKFYLYMYMLLLLVPISIMSRGMLTSMLFQTLFVVIVFNGAKAKTLIKISIFIFIFIYLFGLFGELRYNGISDKLYDVFQISDNYPEVLPKSIMWIYMYITSSINNIENILSTFPDYNFEPYNALYSLIPSILRVHLTIPFEQNLVVEAFNVSSFMPNYLASFGIYGSILFYFIASLIAMSVYYKYTSSYKLNFGFILVILLHSIALSIFSDFFAIQVYVFQIIIQIIVFSDFNRKKRI